jgi:hypothetical protein
MDLLIVADLFVVGLALDLAGAFLLSRGLLAAYPTLTRRAGTYWNGNPHVAVGLAEDRIDGRFGVTYLALGFGLQVVGYVLDLAFIRGRGVGRAGTRRARARRGYCRWRVVALAVAAPRVAETNDPRNGVLEYLSFRTAAEPAHQSRHRGARKWGQAAGFTLDDFSPLWRAR